MKIVGVMRLCDGFVEEIERTVGELSVFCDQVCFVLDHVTDPRILAAVNDCDNLGSSEPYPDECWGHEESLDQGYDLANRFDPDWIVFQDQDELLPFSHLRQAMQAADEQGCNTVVLPVLNCWGDPDTIVWPQLNATGDHARMYRGGQSDFTVSGGGGCSMPSTPHTFLRLQYPYRHMGHMTKSCRERRMGIAYYISKTEPWSTTDPLTFAYQEDWTIDQYASAEVL